MERIKTDSCADNTACSESRNAECVWCFARNNDLHHWWS